MEIEIFQIDAFTSELFKGNPACVMPLDDWLPDELLLNIAKENNVSETAFFVKKNNGYHLRWFTPEIEMDLCGHATLATAYCLKYHLDYKKDKVIFDSMSGELEIKYKGEFIQMDFPHRKPVKANLPKNIIDSLSYKPIEVLKSRDYVLVYENEDKIKNIKIDKELFDKTNLDPGGVVITSTGFNSDFVSRYFVPQCSFFEDPVTGSTHCSLVPYWSEKLGKIKMRSIQLSDRGGEMFCEDAKTRVIINGQAKTYLKGKIYI